MFCALLLSLLVQTLEFPLEENSPETLKWERFLREDRAKQTAFALQNSLEFVPKFRKIFEEAGVPKDLVWLCLIESSFQHHPQSPTGALGMFQFKRETAHILGLKVSAHTDERLHPDKAALAAAKYLAYLRKKFATWELALAAYNWGEGILYRTMRAKQVKTWEAVKPYVREETKNYVGKVKAAAKVGNAFFLEQGIDLNRSEDQEEVALPIETEQPLGGDEEADSDQVDEPGAMPVSPPNQQLPSAFSLQTQAVEDAESEQVPPPITFHIVENGDTLFSLARRYGVALDKLKKANELRSDRLKIGQRLRIPTE